MSASESIEIYLGFWVRMELEAKAEYNLARTEYIQSENGNVLSLSSVTDRLNKAKQSLARAEGGVAALKMAIERIKSEEKQHEGEPLDKNRKDPFRTSLELGARYIDANKNRT